MAYRERQCAREPQCNRMRRGAATHPGNGEARGDRYLLVALDDWYMSARVKQVIRLWVAFVALSATPSLLAQDFTDAQFCQQMQDLAAKINRNIGARLDEVTVQSGMAVRCNEKLVEFKKTLKIPFSNLQDPQWRKRLNDIYCTNDTLLQAVASGWQVTTTITDSTSERLRMTARCP